VRARLRQHDNTARRAQVHSPVLTWLGPTQVSVFAACTRKRVDRVSLTLQVDCFPGGSANLLINDRVPMCVQGRECSVRVCLILTHRYFTAWTARIHNATLRPRVTSWRANLQAPSKVGHATVRCCCCDRASSHPHPQVFREADAFQSGTLFEKLRTGAQIVTFPVIKVGGVSRMHARVDCARA
jgi:hypothetical protein